MRRAVFLDRDGTLIVEKDYLHDPEDLRLLPGVEQALTRAQSANFLLFIVTNQSGVGRGLFTLRDVAAVNQRLERELSSVRFEKIYVAPEAPDQPTYGRKPSPRFLFDARDEFSLDLGVSFMIGDKWSDVECGRNAGVCRTLLVRTGYGAAVAAQKASELGETVVVDDIAAAVDWILKESASS